MTWVDAMIRLGVAVVIGCVIGIEREKKNRPAGLRTHVLVCVGAVLISTLEQFLVQDTMAINAANPGSGIAVNMGRMSAQIISGIGFLGAGTIFTSQKKIAGLTTAASLWNAACLGIVTGMGYYLLALAGCGIVMVTLLLLQRVIKVNSVKSVEVKFVHRVETIAFINAYFEEAGIKVMDIDFHVENRTPENGGNLYTNLYTLILPSHTTYRDIVNHLSEFRNIQAIRTRNT